MTAEETRELRGLVERAQSNLAGLQFLCKLLLRRVGQVESRSPSLDGLVEPMGGEITEILEGIVGAQAAHAEMEKIILS